MQKKSSDTFWNAPLFGERDSFLIICPPETLQIYNFVGDLGEKRGLQEHLCEYPKVGWKARCRNQSFYHFYFFINSLSIFNMGLKYGCFWRKERLKLFYIVLESFETTSVFFVFLTFCSKFQSFRLCFLCGIVLLTIMAFTFNAWSIERLNDNNFMHGRWRWNFSCVNLFCRRSPYENYCHQKLNLERLFLKEALFNTAYSWKRTNWLKEKSS
jgi:hypothetical protein